MTGFRSNGQFYTDPEIAQMDFDIIRSLGMNGFWEQNGGQPGELRKMAAARGIDRSTVYWRSVETPPRDAKLGGVRLEWNSIQHYITRVYSNDVARTRQAHPSGMPTIIADLMDEPAGPPFAGPEYQQEFRSFARQHGMAPEFFGKQTWDEIAAPTLNWREFFKIREQVAGKSTSDTRDSSIRSRRLFYWTAKFWNQLTARLYAMATRQVEELAPGVGTRVNFGPPWWYDYGTRPRGIDAFEFGKLRGVSLGFNEDWCGNGHPRVPMELNTLTEVWNPMLGAQSRAWRPAGDLKRWGEPIHVEDWRRPIFARETTINRQSPTTEPYQNAHGAGLVWVEPRTVGKAYMDGAREVDGKLAKAIVFPADQRREAIVAFAVQAGAQPPATTSASQILAWPLWTQSRGVILLANFSGEPADKLVVRFRSPTRPSKVRSLRSGALTFTAKAQRDFELTLPMEEVTDVLVVE